MIVEFFLKAHMNYQISYSLWNLRTSGCVQRWSSRHLGNKVLTENRHRKCLIVKRELSRHFHCCFTFLCSEICASTILDTWVLRFQLSEKFFSDFFKQQSGDIAWKVLEERAYGIKDEGEGLRVCFQYLEINKSSLVSKGIFRKKWSFYQEQVDWFCVELSKAFLIIPKFIMMFQG